MSKTVLLILIVILVVYFYMQPAERFIDFRQGNEDRLNTAFNDELVGQAIRSTWFEPHPAAQLLYGY
jgi:hypothetical protein